ncbi:MAG TPA: alkaline phosphatase family protein [Chthoniobacterales bacterium]|jgi:phospholipase C|nr:alkaline phosphatase family protein [Chthoniobacterales bacterium]
MPSENTAAASVTLHSNTVSIDDKASKTIKLITYVDGSLQISSGQPSKVPPSIKSNNNVWEITLEAGRHKTSAVADAYNSLCGGNGKEYAPSGGGGGTPKELNFFFGVVLHFQNGGSATIYLGQGSYGIIVTNNWWIGGGPIFSADKPRLEYQSGSQIFTNTLSGDHKTFKLQQTDVRPVSPIQNVFVLMLENHSFDNMLALSGISGIKRATPGNCNSYTDKAGQKHTCCFGPNAPGSMPTDPGHEFPDVLYQLTQTKLPLPKNSYPAINNGGFAENYATSDSEKTGLPTENEVCDIMLGFTTAQQLPALYQLAANFAVCDQWFSSLPGPTWPNRFFLHGASSNGLDHSPTSFEMAEWESVDGFRYPHGSIFDRMKSKGITWRLYHDKNGPFEGSISQVSSIHNIELWDVHPVTDFEKDVQSASYPYQYTFIEPNYGDVASGTYEGGTSQHPMDGVGGGEGLITAVYEAIRNSPIWKQSLLIITYDEHGGFYDHYPPGSVTPPGDGGTKYNKYAFNFAEYGVRVPAVVVSPYIKPGVDPTVYDHSSVLATLEYLFGLGSLTNRDANAKNLIHLISDTMREDTPTKLEGSAEVPASRAPLSAAEKAVLDLQAVPDGSTLVGMMGVLLKADSKISGSAAARARFDAVRTRGEARAYMRQVMTKVEAVRAAGGL